MGKVLVDDLKPTIAEAAAEFGIPEDSIWRKLRAENSGDWFGAQNLKEVRTDAVSPKKARGVMQLTQVALDDIAQAGLFPQMKVEDLSVTDNIRAAAAYIKRLRGYSTDPAVEDAMYNFGPKARFQMDNLPEETADYIQKSGSSSATQSSRTKTTGIPGFSYSPNALVQFLLDAGEKQNARMAEAGQAMSEATRRGIQAQESAIASQQRLVADAAANAGAKAEVEFQQNKLVENLQAMFNMDPAQVNNEISASLSEASAARDARKSARAEYDSAIQTNFLTNPIGWVAAQLKLPTLAAKNNALADQEDDALNNIRVKTDLLRGAKSTLNANTADQVKAIQVRQAQIDKEVADAKLAFESGKLQASAAAAHMQEVQLANQIGDNTRQTLEAVMRIEDREDVYKLRREATEAKLRDKKTADEEEARLNARLAIVSKTLGLVEPVTRANILKMTDKKEQAIWYHAAETGQLGPDLESSLRFYIDRGNRAALISQSPSVYMTAQKLQQSGRVFESQAERENAAVPGSKKLSTAEAASRGYYIYSEMVRDSAMKPGTKVDLSSSQWDRVYNPYVAPHLSFNGAIDTHPQLAFMQKNGVKRIIDDLVKTGAVKGENLTAEQQQQVLGAVVNDVVNRKVDVKTAAANITKYYRGAAAYNRELNKYDLFALPEQKSYMFTLEGNLGIDPIKVDLMNTASVENALMRRVRDYSLTHNAARMNPIGRLLLKD